MRNTYYVRLEEGLCLTSHLRATYTKPFSLREYGKRCCSNFLLIKSSVNKKIWIISVVYDKYTTSSELTLLMKFRVGARLANLF